MAERDHREDQDSTRAQRLAAIRRDPLFKQALAFTRRYGLTGWAEVGHAWRKKK